jgi:hypothetical protein
MGESVNLKKIFLITMIISLTISALIGIFTFIFGNFGSIEIRILVTTLSIGGFSLTALSSSTLQSKGNLAILSWAGIGTSIVGFLWSLLLIWEIGDFEHTWKFMLILIVLAFSIAHSSLLLLINPRKTGVAIVLATTLLFISIVALLLIVLIIGSFDIGELYFRILGVFAILDVLGTVVIPISQKVVSYEDEHGRHQANDSQISEIPSQQQAL